MGGVVVGGVLKELPETLDHLIEHILPQSLIHVLRVGEFDVCQDDLLVQPQKVSSKKVWEAQNNSVSVWTLNL